MPPSTMTTTILVSIRMPCPPVLAGEQGWDANGKQDGPTINPISSHYQNSLRLARPLKVAYLRRCRPAQIGRS
jgi:hypothetical protein